MILKFTGRVEKILTGSISEPIIGVHVRSGGTGSFNLNSTNCSMSHFPELFFFKSILSRKDWQGESQLLKNGTIDGYACYSCYSLAGFTLQGAPGTLAIIAIPSNQI